MKIDYYSVLEISPDATQAQIKQQYQLMIHAWHPDKFPNEDQKVRAQERTKALDEAYSVLGDSVKRPLYDTTRTSEQPKQFYSNPTEGQETSKAEQLLHKEKRAQHEREREDEAEARWRRKFEEEGLSLKKHKPSFLENLFNKARCVVGAHKGQWIYDTSDRCAQIRRCELCQELSTRTAHDWTEWQYQSNDTCDRVRSCKRCQAIDYETKHIWADWEYLGVTDCTQVQLCNRCKVKSEDTRVAHDWGEWSDSPLDHRRSHVCRRCGEKVSELLEPSDPKILT